LPGEVGSNAVTAYDNFDWPNRYSVTRCLYDGAQADGSPCGASALIATGSQKVACTETAYVWRRQSPYDWYPDPDASKL